MSAAASETPPVVRTHQAMNTAFTVTIRSDDAALDRRWEI